MCEVSFQHVKKFAQPVRRRERSIGEIRTLCNIVTITSEDLKILSATSETFPYKISLYDVQLLVRCATAGIFFFLFTFVLHVLYYRERNLYGTDKEMEKSKPVYE